MRQVHKLISWPTYHMCWFIYEFVRIWKFKDNIFIMLCVYYYLLLSRGSSRGAYFLQFLFFDFSFLIIFVFYWFFFIFIFLISRFLFFNYFLFFTDFFIFITFYRFSRTLLKMAKKWSKMGSWPKMGFFRFERWRGGQKALFCKREGRLASKCGF